jgi:hypothetical protein
VRVMEFAFMMIELLFCFVLNQAGFSLDGS